MNQVVTSYQFARMKRKYQWTRGTEILLWSVGTGVLNILFVPSYFNKRIRWNRYCPDFHINRRFSG